MNLQLNETKITEGTVTGILELDDTTGPARTYKGDSL